MGAPRTPRRLRAGAEESAAEHQRTELQPLRAEAGNQPRPHHGRGDWGQETPLRHLGQHCQRRIPDGEHGKGRMHSGELRKINFQDLIFTSLSFLFPCTVFIPLVP